jgi:hypothetical protein
MCHKIAIIVHGELRLEILSTSLFVECGEREEV